MLVVLNKPIFIVRYASSCVGRRSLKRWIQQTRLTQWARRVSLVRRWIDCRLQPPFKCVSRQRERRQASGMGWERANKSLDWAFVNASATLLNAIHQRSQRHTNHIRWVYRAGHQALRNDSTVFVACHRHASTHSAAAYMYTLQPPQPPTLPATPPSS